MALSQLLIAFHQEGLALVSLPTPRFIVGSLKILRQVLRSAQADKVGGA
jgi:hypothetical protein